MNNVITLGKKQITELLKAYNKGVKSTFGLQKSRHQFAQALGFENWFELEAQLDDSASSVLTAAKTDSSNHRLTENYLSFEVRLPDYKSAENFVKFFMIKLQSIAEGRTSSWISRESVFVGSASSWMSRDVLNNTLLKKMMDGYSPDEHDAAPYYYEILEWYDIEQSMTKDDVYSFAFDIPSWDDNLVKELVDAVIKPAVDRFLGTSCIEGEFLSAKIVQQYKYLTEKPV